MLPAPQDALSTANDDRLYLNNGVRLVSPSNDIITAVMRHNGQAINCLITVTCRKAIAGLDPRSVQSEYLKRKHAAERLYKD